MLLFSGGAARADANDEAKRHFTNGVRMFEDRNFAGALVEFEASFQKNPTAVALQNIAVSQKGLFRYANAVATLERMLRDFGAQLSPEDKKAAEDAIHDLSALVGTIVVRVTPPDARVSINDSPLSPEVMKNPIRLAAGEYRVAAEAPGYARDDKMVTVVSGQKDVPLVITLSPLSGTLVIRAHDSQAAIAIDGVQVGYEEWRGPVSAGPHEIYVYTSNLRHKSSVVAYAGQTTEYDAKLTSDDAVPEGRAQGPNAPPPYVPPSQRGLFAFLVFGGDTMGHQAPAGLRHDQARVPGGFVGLRVGYRFSTLIAAEFVAENTSHSIDACRATAAAGCPSVEGKYQFASSRIGPAIRIMSNGRKGRFIGTIGAGAAVHTITYDQLFQTPTRKDASAVGTYLQIEGGYELNLGHFLLDAALGLTAETADDTKVGVKSTATGALVVRVGYGQW